jgi:hypothetical protein
MEDLMKERKNNHTFWAMLALVLLAGFFLLPACASAISIGIEPLSLRPGESGTTNLTLSNIPSGLSGYRTGLKLIPPGIAEITDVRFPDWAALKDQTGFPGPDVSIVAAAFEEVPANPGMTVLATLTLRGIAVGTTSFELYNVTIDDKEGDLINASIEPASIIVSSVTTPSGSVPSSTGNTAGGTTFGAEARVTTQASLIITTTPSEVVLKEEPSMSEGSSLPGTSITTSTVTIPSDQVPSVTTAAHRAPFLSLAGMLGIMVVILILELYKKKR